MRTEPDWRQLAAALAEALEDLRAEQNGPPLSAPRHAEAWARAVNAADEALERYTAAEQAGGGDDAAA
jgi:hypothetical protein